MLFRSKKLMELEEINNERSMRDEAKLISPRKFMDKVVEVGKSPCKHHSGIIEADCSEEAPCLIWYAWKVRSDEIVLRATELSALDFPAVLPTFTVTSARPTNKKLSSEYLRDPVWLEALSSAVKGAKMIQVSEELRKTADYICGSLEARLSLHISGDRVDSSKQNHWTVRLFARENLPAMAAAICIFGHIVDDDISTYGIEDCLLRLQMKNDEDGGFCLIDGDHYVGSLKDAIYILTGLNIGGFAVEKLLVTDPKLAFVDAVILTKRMPSRWMK